MTEIKYKDTTIPVEAGQTVTLNTADKKLTGDIEVTAPKESGGGAKKYNISYDTFAVTETIAQPTEIYEGQMVHFVFTTGAGYLETVTNCEHNLKQYDRYYSSYYSSWVHCLTLFNPIGDVFVKLQVTGGSN